MNGGRHDHHDHDHDHHDHDHDHDHDHAPPADDDGPGGDDAVLEQAIRELLIEKGVLTAADIHRQIDFQDSRNETLGARIVARAWTDPAFKAALLSHPLPAIQAAFGIDMTTPLELIVLENRPGLHNMVVCTLCSCYPRMLLGPPPAWYRAKEYRSRAVREPRAVLSEFGVQLPADMEIRVADSTADIRYLVLPERPAGTDGWSEEQLAALVTRDAMIGTGVPSAG